MTWKNALKIFGIVLFLVLLERSFLSFLFSFQLPILIFALSLGFLASDKAEFAFFTALIGGLLMDFAFSHLAGLISTFFIFILLLILYIKKHFFDNAFFLNLCSILAFSLLWKAIFLGEGAHFSLTFFLANYISFLVFTYLIKKLSHESNSF